MHAHQHHNSHGKGDRRSEGSRFFYEAKWCCSECQRSAALSKWIDHCPECQHKRCADCVVEYAKLFFNRSGTWRFPDKQKPPTRIEPCARKACFRNVPIPEPVPEETFEEFCIAQRAKLSGMRKFDGSSLCPNELVSKTSAIRPIAGEVSLSESPPVAKKQDPHISKNSYEDCLATSPTPTEGSTTPLKSPIPAMSEKYTTDNPASTEVSPCPSNIFTDHRDSVQGETDTDLESCSNTDDEDISDLDMTGFERTNLAVEIHFLSILRYDLALAAFLLPRIQHLLQGENPERNGASTTDQMVAENAIGLSGVYQAALHEYQSQAVNSNGYTSRVPDHSENQKRKQAESYSGVAEASQSHSQAQISTNTNQLQKRGRSPDDPERPNEESRAIRKKAESEDGFEIIWACHFHKYRPRKYGSWSSTKRYYNCACPRIPYDRLRDIKGHQKTAHIVEQCVRCYSMFDSTALLEAHQRQDIPCVALPKQIKEGIDDGQLNMIGKILGKTNKAHAVEKWFQIWDFLFPGLPRPPSPWSEPAAEDPRAGTPMNGNEAIDFARVERIIDELTNQGLISTDTAIRATIVQIIRNAWEGHPVSQTSPERPSVISPDNDEAFMDVQVLPQGHITIGLDEAWPPDEESSGRVSSIWNDHSELNAFFEATFYQDVAVQEGDDVHFSYTDMTLSFPRFENTIAASWEGGTSTSVDDTSQDALPYDGTYFAMSDEEMGSSATITLRENFEDLLSTNNNSMSRDTVSLPRIPSLGLGFHEYENDNGLMRQLEQEMQMPTAGFPTNRNSERNNGLDTLRWLEGKE